MIFFSLWIMHLYIKSSKFGSTFAEHPMNFRDSVTQPSMAWCEKTNNDVCLSIFHHEKKAFWESWSSLRVSWLMHCGTLSIFRTQKPGQRIWTVWTKNLNCMYQFHKWGPDIGMYLWWFFKYGCNASSIYMQKCS